MYSCLRREHPVISLHPLAAREYPLTGFSSHTFIQVRNSLQQRVDFDARKSHVGCIYIE